MSAYMSKRHAEIEAIFEKLPGPCRVPKVYLALCSAAKIRESAVKNRLSAIKLFRSLEEEKPTPAPAPEPAKLKKPAKGEKPPKKKRSWEEEFEAALEGKADEKKPKDADEDEGEDDEDEDDEEEADG